MISNRKFLPFCKRHDSTEVNILDNLIDNLSGNTFNPEHTLPEISGFDEYSEISNQDVENLIQNLLPEGHLDGCESITCNPNDPFWRQYGAGGYYREAMGDIPPEICVAGRAIIEGTGYTELGVLCHEIGHNVFFNMDMANMQEWAVIHTESQVLYDQTGFGFVSNYAHTNLTEDFAETYAAYITAPDFLQFVSPEKYEFMQEKVFGGTEYEQISTGAGEAVLVTKQVANSYSQGGGQTYAATDALIASSEQNTPTDAIYRCFNKIA